MNFSLSTRAGPKHQICKDRSLPQLTATYEKWILGLWCLVCWFVRTSRQFRSQPHMLYLPKKETLCTSLHLSHQKSGFCQACTLFRFSHTWHGFIWLIILLFLIISYLPIYNTYIKTLCITQTFSLMLVYLLVITKNYAFNL